MISGSTPFPSVGVWGSSCVWGKITNAKVLNHEVAEAARVEYLPGKWHIPPMEFGNLLLPTATFKGDICDGFLEDICLQYRSQKGIPPSKLEWLVSIFHKGKSTWKLAINNPPTTKKTQTLNLKIKNQDHRRFLLEFFFFQTPCEILGVAFFFGGEICCFNFGNKHL